MQLYVNLKNSSVISCSEPLRELFGWIWLGVAVIGPQDQRTSYKYLPKIASAMILVKCICTLSQSKVNGNWLLCFI